MSKKKAKKSKKTKAKKLAPGFTICPDCKGEYKIGAPHRAFCEAKTCSQCMTTFPDVIEKNADGDRVCEGCKSEDEDDNYDDYLDEELDESDEFLE